MRSNMNRVSRLEKMGLSSRGIIEFFENHPDLNIHSLAVVRDHKVYAVSRKPWKEDAPHTLFSLSKSFCSMAAGIAMKEGRLSPEDLLVEVLPEVLPIRHDPKLGQIRLKHLLSMSSGLDPKSDQRLQRFKKDWAREALVYPVAHAPGERFHYNTFGTYLAGRMVEKRAGMTLRNYLMPRLFEPLGIGKPQWDCCKLGHNLGGTGLHLSCLDIARAAQMLLNQGSWQNQQLLPVEYIQQATRKQVDNRVLDGPNPHEDWLQGYGWQFWMCRHGRYRGDGMYGQIMMVDPNHDLAIAVTAGENMMGSQMDALHLLADDLLRLPPENQQALAAFEETLDAGAPLDRGEALFGEGSYWTRDGRYLRLEIHHPDRLRLVFQGKGQDWLSDFQFTRKTPYQGEYASPVAGEKPQKYLGQFGVKDGALSVQALMPEAPYQLKAVIRQTKKGLEAVFQNVGMDSGKFLFLKAKQG